MNRMRYLILTIFIVMSVIISGCGNQENQAQPEQKTLWEQSTLKEILDRGTLRVGLEAGYMPFEMRSTKGEIIGFDVDMAEEMAKAMGVELELVNTAWDGIIPALLTEKFDIIMSGMTITPKRNLKINFCDPYITVGQAILVNKDKADEINSYKDLNSEDVTLATKLGVTADEATKRLTPKAKRRLFESEQEAFQELLNGNVDATVYDFPILAIFNAKYPDKFKFISEPFTYEPLAWAIRKGDPDFLNWLNNFLHQMRGDGRYDAIYDKWFNSADWQKNIQ